VRVLHIANFSLGKNGTVFYSTDRKLSAGFTRAGHFVYDISDRDMARSLSRLNSKKLGRNKLNEAVLRTVANLQPEFLLLGHTDLLHEKTLDEARRLAPGLRIAQWFVDPLFEPHARQHLLERLPHLDAFFCTTAGDWLDPFRKVNPNCYYLPNPVDPAIECQRNDEKTAFDHDLLYVGIDYKDPARTAMLEALSEKTGELRFKLHGSLGQPPIFGAAYLDLLSRSKMGLNLSRRNDIPYYSSDRIAQLTGNGLLTFIPETPGFRTLFSDDEVVYFDGTADLVEKALHYNRHDDARRGIAARGRERAHRSYHAERIAGWILAATLGTARQTDYEWHDA